MNKVNLHEIKEEVRRLESPKKTFCNVQKSITKALTNRDEHKRQPPFDMDYVTLPPGKKDFPYHVHATGWELYCAVKGSAHMRVEEDLVELKPGDAIQCPPGVAHQIINDSDADFEYWLISSSPDFDTAYYPDSDKLTVQQILGANKEGVGNDRGGSSLWTRFREGLGTSYWEGEE